MFRNLIRTAAVTVGAAALVGVSGLAAQATPDTSPGAAPDYSTTAAAPHSFSNCLVGDFCGYSGANGTGTKKAWYICQKVKPSPFSTTAGSAYNNQTGGAPAKIYFKDGLILTIYPGGGAGITINWANVSYIITCPITG